MITSKHSAHIETEVLVLPTVVSLTMSGAAGGLALCCVDFLGTSVADKTG